jgi:hypothetical protein
MSNSEFSLSAYEIASAKQVLALATETRTRKKQAKARDSREGCAWSYREERSEDGDPEALNSASFMAAADGTPAHLADFNGLARRYPSRRRHVVTSSVPPRAWSNRLITLPCAVVPAGQ